MKIKEFIESVCKQIKYKPIRQNISEELENHIKELKEEFILNGDDEQIAEEKAVLQMGDSTMVGKELNKVHKTRLDWKLLILLICLICFGLLSAFIRTSNNVLNGDYTNSMKKFAMFFSIGLIISVFVYFFNYTKIKKYSYLIYMCATAITLCSIMFGSKINGNACIRMGTFSISTAIVVIPMYVIAFAGILENIKVSKKYIIFNKTINIELVKIVALSLISLFLINQIPAMALTIILTISYLILSTVKLASIEKNRRRNLIILWSTTIGVLTIMAVLLFVSSSFRRERIIASFYPESDPNGAGFVGMGQKNIIDSANWIGEANDISSMTDIVKLFDAEGSYTSISILAHYGWIAIGSLICIVLLVSIKLILNSSKMKDSYGKMLIIGISSLFILKSVFHILMNFNLGIQSSFDLPFVSYSGIDLIINMVCMALILSVYRKKDVLQYENKIQEEFN